MVVVVVGQDRRAPVVVVVVVGQDRRAPVVVVVVGQDRRARVVVAVCSSRRLQRRRELLARGGNLSPRGCCLAPQPGALHVAFAATRDLPHQGRSHCHHGAA